MAGQPGVLARKWRSARMADTAAISPVDASRRGVATEARKAIAAAGERTLLLGKGSPFFDLQLPCGGGITVAIHVLRTADEVAVHVR